jgi:hypothetical protein
VLSRGVDRPPPSLEGLDRSGDRALIHRFPHRDARLLNRGEHHRVRIFDLRRRPLRAENAVHKCERIAKHLSSRRRSRGPRHLPKLSLHVVKTLQRRTDRLSVGAHRLGAKLAPISK